MTKLILLSNDDGIWAGGLKALYDGVKDLGDVWVVAPDTERSATGHAITLSTPIRVKEIDFHNKGITGYACSGTPADCVKIAVDAILPRKPDILISGINHGANLGVNVLYSGTVSAATEGMLLNVPSIAVSLATFKKADYSYAQKLSAIIAENVIKNGLPGETLLNVNIPPVPEDKIAGIKITKHGRSTFKEHFDRRVDPRNRVYYWLSGTEAEIQEDSDRDGEVIKQNFVSVTPIHYNLTDESNFDKIGKWSLFN
ncbi:MAG: 5'/3'-nucleotidase SurE [Candidatus Marinimicrobia bacterium]|nr:5'/3'-nucleotidase SurE [Candidatus Neomarinimicrobiota bacterium]MBL7022867.1 5'/3'-nucleotidase SurE [Candidatus Neomarinimicrobiota bacterium]MBL7109186.1 5'/3'-nucleotidase SurE [Candidatus Neomarinimicrobiota bacterium]